MDVKVGTILIFGVVMAPVYIMLLGWFLGGPREIRTPLLGVGYLVGITVGMWVGLAGLAVVLGLAN
jgi:hypothetical protein